MPIVEKPLTESELRAQIARLQTLIKNNPATAADQTRRLQDVQNELNKLLLAQGGWSVTKDVEVEARVSAARKEGHAAAVVETAKAAEAEAAAAVKAAAEAEAAAATAKAE